MRKKLEQRLNLLKGVAKGMEIEIQEIDMSRGEKVRSLLKTAGAIEEVTALIAEVKASETKPQ